MNRDGKKFIPLLDAGLLWPSFASNAVAGWQLRLGKGWFETNWWRIYHPFGARTLANIHQPPDTGRGRNQDWFQLPFSLPRCCWTCMDQGDSRLLQALLHVSIRFSDGGNYKVWGTKLFNFPCGSQGLGNHEVNRRAWAALTSSMQRV